MFIYEFVNKKDCLTVFQRYAWVRDGRDQEDARRVGWGDQGLDVFGLKLEETVGRSLGSHRTTLPPLTRYSSFHNSTPSKKELRKLSTSIP